MRLILFLMRISSGAVFVYSGWEKLLAPVQNFMAVIGAYQLVPSGWIPYVASVFPWLELVVGTFLLLGFLARTSAAVLSLFLIVFISLLARSLWLHLALAECGCFGSGILLKPEQALMLDIGLLFVSGILVCCPARFLSLDQKLSGKGINI